MISKRKSSGGIQAAGRDRLTDLHNCREKGLISTEEYNVMHSTLIASASSTYNETETVQQQKENITSNILFKHERTLASKRVDLLCTKDHGLITAGEYQELSGKLEAATGQNEAGQQMDDAQVTQNRTKEAKLADILCSRDRGLISREEYNDLRARVEDKRKEGKTSDVGRRVVVVGSGDILCDMIGEEEQEQGAK
jgi:hypothetical protein